MKHSCAIDINVTPEKVWYWLGDPEKAKVWQTSVARTEIVHQTPDWIGTTFRETVEGDAQGVKIEGVVTDYRENQALTMHLSSKFHTVDVAWRLEGIKNHTHLTVKADIRFKSFMRLLSLLFWPAFKKQLTGQFQKELGRLRELCEQGT